MKKIELVGIGIRFLSIAVFLMALTKLAAVSIYFYEKNNSNESIIAGVSFFTLFVLSVILWLFPLIIAKKIIPRVKEENINIKWSIEELKESGLILLGLYLMFNVISDAVFWIILVLTNTSYGEGIDVELRPEDISSIYVTVLEFFLAFIMILGARGIFKIIKYIRQLGVK